MPSVEGVRAVGLEPRHQGRPREPDVGLGATDLAVRDLHHLVGLDGLQDEVLEGGFLHLLRAGRSRRNRTCHGKQHT